MTSRQCPECGRPLQGNEPSCPDCGFPLQPTQNPSSANFQIQDEGDNQAEDILRKWLNWVKLLMIICSAIGGVGCVIWGIVGASADNGNALWFFVGILLGVITFYLGRAVAWLVWSIGMVFINISTNVRRIKQLIQK